MLSTIYQVVYVLNSTLVTRTKFVILSLKVSNKSKKCYNKYITYESNHTNIDNNIPTIVFYR